MQLTRWAPFQSDFAPFQEAWRQGLFGSPGLAGGYPATNAWTDEHNVYVECELPGMNQEDLDIFVAEGNQLSIGGERKRPELEHARWHRQERGFGKFRRTIELPFAVEADKVEAQFENGVLLITLPKSEHVKPRRIAVKSD
jgi:HSP20 family protein